MRERLSAIVLAGGMGTRFGSDTPKQLTMLAGRPILSYTLELMDRCLVVDSIVVASNPEWSGTITRIVKESVRQTHVRIVAGGDNRNESVWRALEGSSDLLADQLVVHDGVRPLATEALLRRVIAELKWSDAVLPVIESADPLALVAGGVVQGIQDRNSVVRGQSPQGFRAEVLTESLGSVDAAKRARYATLFEVLMHTHPGARIRTVEGELNNIKVTQSVDMEIATALLAEAAS